MPIILGMGTVNDVVDGSSRPGKRGWRERLADRRVNRNAFREIRKVVPSELKSDASGVLFSGRYIHGHFVYNVPEVTGAEASTVWLEVLKGFVATSLNLPVEQAILNRVSVTPSHPGRGYLFGILQNPKTVWDGERVSVWMEASTQLLAMVASSALKVPGPVLDIMHARVLGWLPEISVDASDGKRRRYLLEENAEPSLLALVSALVASEDTSVAVLDSLAARLFMVSWWELDDVDRKWVMEQLNSYGRYPARAVAMTDVANLLFNA